MKSKKQYISVIFKPVGLYILITIIAMLCYLLINCIYIIILRLIIGDFNFDIPSFDEKPLKLIVYGANTIAFYLWYRKLKDSDEKAIESKEVTPKDIGLLLVLGLGETFTTYGVMNSLVSILYNYIPSLIDDYINMTAYISEDSLIFVLLTTVILGSIIEELICRGVILKRASRIMPFYAANILQALLFALAHMNLIQIIYTFPIGLLYGYLVNKYQSIISSIILHILGNGLAVMISRGVDSLELPYL